MKQELGVCILCGRETADGDEILSAIADIAAEVIIVTATRPESAAAPCRNRGIPIAFISADDSYREAASAVRNARSEWILLLNAGEAISADHKQKLRALCAPGDGSAYSVNTEKRMAAGELSPYEWLGNLGKYSAASVLAAGYIPCREVRLFRKGQFSHFAAAGDGTVRPVLAPETVSIRPSDIRLTLCMPCPSPVEAPQPELQREEDRQRFQGTLAESAERTGDFDFLERDSIGYSMVDQKDLPSLARGLEMGLGNIDLLKFMVHSLIKDGSYERAIEFADAIAAKMGEHMELWRLKGTAYFYMLKLADAERCFLSALSFNAKDRSLLSNLAKVSIISGRHDQARQWLHREIAVGGITPELDFMRNLIDDNRGRAVTLSVLMLCRDEEQYIERALDSVKDIADQIVIVDTGSRDRTVALARAYGATVVDSPWDDDFASARNDGLHHVAGEYVLCLDADEYLETEARMTLLVLKHLLPAEKKIAVALDIHTLPAEYGRNRESLPPVSVERRTAIFPLLAGVRYHGRIFERIDDCLERLEINRIVARNIHISHKSDNPDERKARKAPALMKSHAESLSAAMVFDGVNHWIDSGHVERALEWFGRAVTDANGSTQYVRIICRLIRYFDQHGSIDIQSPLFKELLSRYSRSYSVMTVCADILSRKGAYGPAAEQLNRLIADQDHYQDEPIEKEQRQLNLLNMALVSLESDDFARGDRILALLSAEPDMGDTVQAVLFYYRVRKMEIEEAISLLDSWIRERNLPITGTIDSFVDLLGIIAAVAEKMLQYGKSGAGRVLIRASEHLAERIGVKE
ncbi:MAG: glycosyltransferase [Syntrophales bacterium]